MTSWVPLVWLWFGTSRQRAEPAPSRRPETGGGGPATAVMLRLSTCAVSPWLVPKPTCPTLHAVSVAVVTVAPSICAVMVLPENVSARLCHELVPSAATVPLRSAVMALLVSLRNSVHAPVLLTRR